ncbi:MAG: DUF4097 family beta strand repeat protein [Clostridia bacterium]|nr:DUF4097 family beta strand repeat protein [Clostridia bacterium]
MGKGVKALLIIAACIAALGILLIGIGVVNGVQQGISEGFDLVERILFGGSDTPIEAPIMEPVQTDAPSAAVPTPTPAPADVEDWSAAPGITIPTPAPTPVPTDEETTPLPTPMPASASAAEPSAKENAIDIKVSDLPVFNSIQVDVTTADISILPADGTEVSLSIHYGDARHNPTYKVENGCLYIKDDPHKAKWDSKSFKEIMQDIAGSLFSIGGKGKIEIYLPVGTEYDKFEAETTTGDIICSAAITAHELSVETTTGDIRVSGGIYDKIDAECTTGDVSFADGSYGRVTAECTTGDISLEGILSGSISLSCTTGDVVIVSALPQHNYSIDTSCTSGNITVDGHQCGKTYKGGKGEIRLDAETTTGDIHMSFSE